MKQIILELLNEKFKGARKDTLLRLATAYSAHTTTREEAQALVDKLQEGQVTEFEREYRSEVDQEISKAIKTAVDRKNDKNTSTQNQLSEDNKQDGKSSDINISSIIENAIKEATSPLLEEINAIKQTKATETRIKQLESALKDVRPEIREKTLKDFSRMSFNDDESFSIYLDETKNDIQKLNKVFINSKLNDYQPYVNTGSDSNLTEKDYDALV